MGSFTALCFGDVSSIIPINLVKFTSIYLFWSFLHIAASNFYTKYCAELSLWGWFTSGFKSMSPECYYAHWIQNATSSYFGTWWFTTATWSITKFNWIKSD